MAADPRSLSIVMPVFNEGQNLSQTLTSLLDAVRHAGITDSTELVVVDDGSTDGSHEIVEAVWDGRLTLIRQENRGRLTARRRGLEASTGEHVLMLDARTRLDEHAIGWWLDQIEEHPDRRLWNGHTVFGDDGNHYARFWEILTNAGWSAYHDHPRLVSYTLEEFDAYPKGTGMFVAPRSIWLAAYDDLDRSGRASLPKHLVSDDTALLRHMIEREGKIWLSPDFSAEYLFPRTTLSAFVRNSFYRGGTFVDGYVQSSSRIGSAVRRFRWLAMGGGTILVVGMVRSPLRTTAAFVAACLTVITGGAAVAVRRGLEPKEALRVGTLALPFSLAFSAGMVRGHLLRALFRRR